MSLYYFGNRYDGTHPVGGISGNNAGNITNCMSSAAVICNNDTTYGSRVVGGIVGINNKTLENCLFLGSVSGTNSTQNAICGSSGKNATQENCYKAYNIITEGGSTATVENLNDSSFYTDTLKWDSAIWDVTELNYERGLIVKLK